MAAAVVLAAAALVLPPRPYGDAAEYLLMAESWAAHGSPEVRPGDVEALRRKAAASGLAVDPDDALGNYFQGEDRRSYSYHFWAYPLLTMPARLVLHAIGGDVLRAGPLTNAILFAAAIAAVLAASPASTFARRAAAALLATSPALGFLLWPHPEVLSFAGATLALAAGVRGATGSAATWAAVASTQNPPLALLVVFEASRPYLAGRPRWTARTLAALGAAALVALASPLFYFALFRTPSMVAGQATGVQPASAARALGLVFDLELGLVRYAPLTVAALLGAIPLVLRGRARRLEVGLLAILAVMMLACSATGNWNHGTTGPSRYVVWLFPMMAYLLTLGPTASRLLAARPHLTRLALIVVVAAQAVVAAARGGVLSPLDYLEHSTAARLVLDRRPSWYGPDHEVFRERTAHTEAELGGPFVHQAGGRCRKALVQWKHAGVLQSLCGDPPPAARSFFESRPPREEKSRWIYVDYP